MYELYTDVFEPDVFHQCYEKLNSSSGWKYAGFSNDVSPIRFWFHDLNNDPTYTVYGLARINKLTGRQFKIDRVYANGQTHGLSGDLHQDHTEPNKYTFLMYMNPEWKVTWGGTTVFYIDDNHSTGVMPKPNCGVLFPSNIWHAGLEPTRHCHELRITVAYKLELVV